MKKYFRDYVFLGLIAGVIVVLDQWTKYLVRNYIPLGERWAPWPWLMDYVRIVHWSNTGAAFGMLQGFGIVFTVLAIIVSIVIIIYYPRIPSSEWPLRIALGLQLGGALGNLIDRLTQTYVTDFISVGNFAVFNIADASISVGVAVLIIGVWIKEKQQAQDIENPPAGPLPEEPKSE